MTLKRYVVTIDGFDGVEITAQTAGKAKAEIYRRLTDAGWDMSFKEFLGKISVLHFGPIESKEAD